MTSPLTAVGPEDRLLDSMIAIRDYAAPRIHADSSMLAIMNTAEFAIREYREAMKKRKEPRYSVISGTIESKGGPG